MVGAAQGSVEFRTCCGDAERFNRGGRGDGGGRTAAGQFGQGGAAAQFVNDVIRSPSAPAQSLETCGARFASLPPLAAVQSGRDEASRKTRLRLARKEKNGPGRVGPGLDTACRVAGRVVGGRK